MIHVPAALLYLASIGLVLLIGSGITAVAKLTARVRALEGDQVDLRSHVIRLQGILYEMNPNAFRSDE
jgi:hypothetical protein